MTNDNKLLFRDIDEKLYYDTLKSNDRLKITKSDISTTIGSKIKIQIKDSILEYIDNRIAKILIVEINLRRINNKFLSTDPKDQYKEFVRDPKLLSYISSKYSRLFTEVKLSVQDMIQFYVEFLSRFQKDYKIICEFFGINGALIDIYPGMGDSHRKHHSVLELVFEDNTIFYKPRNSYGDLAIKNISNWLMNNGINSFKIPKCIVNKDYSWVKGVTYSSTDKDKLKSIYYQFGTLTAISYIFNLTDLHMENIIVSGNDLYLIDAETLLQDDFIDGFGKQTAKDIIYRNLHQSVLMTNLLPISLFSDEDTLDVSGITGHGGQLLKHSLTKIENPYTSKMVSKKINYVNKNSKNIPYIDNKDKIINPKNYAQSILLGFIETFSLILKNRESFLTERNIWDNFDKGIYRIVFKNTRSYGAILNAITNPKYAQSDDNTKSLLNLLKSGNNASTAAYNIFPSEVADILNGDIPYFYKKATGSNVYNSKDKLIYTSKVFSSVSDYKKRICNFSISDIEKQAKIIKIAMATPIKNWDLGKTNNFTSSKLKSISYDKNKIEHSVNEIFNEIINNGFTYKDTINWQNIRILDNSNWTISPSDFMLYDGLSGISIAFAVAYKITGNRRYQGILSKCLTEIESMYGEIISEFQDYSAFNGVGSLIYLYFYLFSLFHKNAYFEKGVFYLKSLQSNIDTINKIDYIDGASGILAILCEIEDKFPNQNLIYIINSLISNIAKHWDDKEAWKSDMFPKHHLNGMSHGISGIIYALFKARKYSKNVQLDSLIQKAIYIEDQGIDGNNWVDLRNRRNRKKMDFPNPAHWCHGAPGIGLSRIILNSEFDTKQDIELSKSCVLEEGIGGSDCLCHGSLGNLDLFVEDYLINNNQQSLQIARKIATNLCTKDNWVSGIPQKVTVFGIMTGLSGMAYELLRILYPKEVPSILLLELSKG